MEIVVIGGGLGGLCSAIALARSGHAVRLLEQGQHLGARARSRQEHGYIHNLGAHALYLRGAAARVLAELGIAAPGGQAEPGEVSVFRRGRLHPFPSNFGAFVLTTALDRASKLQLAPVLAMLGPRLAAKARGMRVREWLDARALRPDARAFLELLFRLACYANAPDLVDTELAILQLAAAAKGVAYLDGGWQCLVDQAEALSRAAGVSIEHETTADRIDHGARVQAVRTRDGRTFNAGAVIAAVAPEALARLLPGDRVAAGYAQAATPLMAAVLDVGVAELPEPERVVVLDADAPLYFANHAKNARLATAGGATLHLVRYLAPGEDGRDVEPELRTYLERVQPGALARAEVVRFMPNLIVHNDIPGPWRAPGAHPEIAGLHLVGDWIDSGALLLDGVLASAQQAVSRIGPLKLAAASVVRDAAAVA
jgi:phytoene dehydrogenase-like protein